MKVRVKGLVIILTLINIAFVTRLILKQSKTSGANDVGEIQVRSDKNGKHIYDGRNPQVQNRIQIESDTQSQKRPSKDMGGDSKRHQPRRTNTNSMKYVVDTLTCKIPELNPFDQAILQLVDTKPVEACEPLPLLTYVEGTSVQVNKTILKNMYNAKGIKCVYQYILWKKDNGNDYTFTDPLEIDLKEGYFLIRNDFIRVTCYKGESKEVVYRHFHSSCSRRMHSGSRGVHGGKPKDDDPGRNMNKHMDKDNDGNSWNVMLIGTDSLSASAAKRFMPKTVEYLTSDLEAIEMRGFAKVGYYTKANIIPLLTGRHLEELLKPHMEHLDDLPFIFKNYKSNGYSTAFMEDDPTSGAFTSPLPGFKKPPTDLYMRPYMLAMNESTDWTVATEGYDHCMFHEYRVTEMLSTLKAFAELNVDKKHLSLTYTSTFAHKDGSGARKLDHIYPGFLHNLKQSGVFRNTFLIFFADQGQRFDSTMLTSVGRVEGRLPMMYITVPPKFKSLHPEYYHNLQVNSRRLTSHFDIYKTMLHILDLNGAGSRGSSGDTQSLLESIVPLDRTCKSTNIPLHGCPCMAESLLDKSLGSTRSAVSHLVAHLNSKLKHSQKECSRLMSDKIHSAVKLLDNKNEGGPSTGQYTKHYRIIFSTTPGDGMFEGTISQSVTSSMGKGTPFSVFIVQEPITRLNAFSMHTSYCIDSPLLRLYCYCKMQAG